jgi:lysophospholipase L1-like esterase
MRYQWLFPILATAVGLIVAALALEVVVRLVLDDGMQYDLEMSKYALELKQVSTDPLLGHAHAPNRHATLMGVDFRTNSRGLRDREFAYDREPGTFRILMLGDSMTVGWGVRAEATFSKRIEAMYREGGIAAEVINAGVGNYNTVQEIEYFLTEGHRYRPDLVVLNFYPNDAEPVPVSRPPPTLLRVCRSCVLIAGALDTLARKYFDERDWAQYYLSLYSDGTGRGWLDARESIRKLVEYCKANDIRALIAILPDLHDVQHYRLQLVSDLVQAAAAEFDIPFVDVLPHLQAYDSSALWVTAPDPHANALAHAVIAQALFDTIEELRSKQQKDAATASTLNHPLSGASLVPAARFAPAHAPIQPPPPDGRPRFDEDRPDRP